ncbi:hypothetical protein CR513_11800, partial [Mucuna pruriens]
MVNEIGAVDNLRLENQLTELTSLVRQLAVRQHQPSIAARVCSICTSVEHPTDMCPMLQEIESNYLESVGAIGATVPTTTITKNPSSRQFTISGGHDEAISNKQSRQNTNATIQDLKAQIGQLANTSVGSSNPPSQTIPNLRGNVSVVTLKSGKALPQPAPQQFSRSTNADSKLDANSQMPQQDKTVPLPFPTWTLSARKLESDEELLKMFRKVEINIPLLDAIKKIPKYAKFLKELCVHKRKKKKGSVEIGGIVSVLTRNEDFTVSTHGIETIARSYEQLPIIIASNLRREQEDKLLSVLRQHKKAIGWKLSDLPRINPSICMHRILMEEESKPIR